MSKVIKERVPVTELLAGLAEECNELAHAALKLRRVLDGGNPTPVTVDDALENLYEEIADVNLYCDMISYPENYVKRIMMDKQVRWEERLREQKVRT